MRTAKVLFVLGVVLATSSVTGASSAATPVSGTIRSDTTWGVSGSPYQLVDTVGVDTGATLTIEAGVRVEVLGPHALQVAGTLVTQGTDDLPVVFTCRQLEPNCWSGIQLVEGQSGSILDGAEIGYAATGFDATQGDWSMSDSVLHSNDVGARVSGGTFTHNYVRGNGIGINTAFDLSQFDLNTVTENRIGIFSLGQGGAVTNNNIYGNSQFDVDVCFSDGDTDIDASNNWWGTTETAVIAAYICDGSDDGNSPRVLIDPIATSAISGAAVAPSSDASAVSHPRSLSLRLTKHLKTTGTVSVDDAFTGCVADRLVTIQRRKGGSWGRVGTDRTDSTGRFAARVKDRAGKYRVVLSEDVEGVGNDVCSAATSQFKRHRH